MPIRKYVCLEEYLNNNRNVKTHLVNISQLLPLLNETVYQRATICRIKVNAGFNNMIFLLLINSHLVITTAEYPACGGQYVTPEVARSMDVVG